MIRTKISLIMTCMIALQDYSIQAQQPSWTSYIPSAACGAAALFCAYGLYESVTFKPAKDMSKTYRKALEKLHKLKNNKKVSEELKKQGQEACDYVYENCSSQLQLKNNKSSILGEWIDKHNAALEKNGDTKETGPDIRYMAWLNLDGGGPIPRFPTRNPKNAYIEPSLIRIRRGIATLATLGCSFGCYYFYPRSVASK